MRKFTIEITEVWSYTAEARSLEEAIAKIQDDYGAHLDGTEFVCARHVATDGKRLKRHKRLHA